VPRLRPATEALPTEIASRDGLSYSLWLPHPAARIRGGVAILHGASSCKESHHDFARVVLAAGFAALAFDQRGHGESDGAIDGRALDDITAMTARLRAAIGDPAAPVALRGSSMGGYFALVAAAPVGAAAVVAICPAGAEDLRRGLNSGALNFAADVPALDNLLAAHELPDTVAALEMPVLLLHAEGDHQVPVEHSRELARHLRSPRSRLITLPGGHHRSIQHDPEMQAVSLRFIERAIGASRPRH